MSHLLQPIILGDSLELRNRIVMGSMTRNRNIDENKPTEASVTHYSVRARDGVGLIVAEGTFVYLNGAEWQYAPLMFDESHAQAWKKVTDAVHQEGGKIFFQPWHPGRIQNENMPMLKESGYPVLAPSRIPAAGGKFRVLEGAPGHTHAITEIEDPKEIVAQFATSVRLAKQAGFDGIELLCQGGYLLHSFLSSRSNNRTDAYGGSVENRCRFVLEVVDAIIEVWGPRTVGIKICPTDDYNDSTVSYSELSETYSYLIRQCVARDLAFINLSRRGSVVGHVHDEFNNPKPVGMELPPGYEPLNEFGPLVKHPESRTMLMVNHEYTVEEAEALVKEGKVDLVTFARPFISNPDMITRIRKGIPLAVNNRGAAVHYGPYQDVNENYNDWPYAA
ncbi:FMN-linked oxidoreductase [Heliocybe sulcata]|uniref:FMN-linked oxidoreductase n=1 Tax=Heliocybe sulcata TaxID=5364 RepID=A0A5C3NBG4_9AGAM|nr:FMN-linked oxidoreductase [Heliocybe sulcata]